MTTEPHPRCRHPGPHRTPHLPDRAPHLPDPGLARPGDHRATAVAALLLAASAATVTWLLLGRGHGAYSTTPTAPTACCTTPHHTGHPGDGRPAWP
ncbi:hypothetical protein [Streptomyces sp. CB02923]|uniref:hypothetical protein n=1 Tax=Streptomyces sp. CB02923 TaxID=1718985 RepID=UPI001900AEEF|nr:hypothetical protein [Streptomyces sp. CB02923]